MKSSDRAMSGALLIHPGVQKLMADRQDGRAYGYRVVKPLDARGEPVRGEREIIAAEAEIVRRIFREDTAGKGPQRIAADLNSEGIAGRLPSRPRAPSRGWPDEARS
ncbi:recombinase family protein [Ancylobacter sp. SL191]|uniref:recombinase family protein n=1 Tax=Ancylobacter sp. SL191 TaxID=2995166 RepID=UPI002D1E410A|nr:recombinase family protein [Ancylobacter sp. SL191]